MYDYCVDNPLSRVDPSGLWTKETFDEARVNRDDIGRFAVSSQARQGSNSASTNSEPAFSPGSTDVTANADKGTAAGPEEGEDQNAYYHRLLKEKADGHAINEQTDIAIKGPRFFVLTPLLEEMAKELDVDVDFLLAHAAHESGWFNDHNTGLNNLFGVNIRGGAGNRNYESLDAAIQNWIDTFGDWVRGSETMEDYIYGLRHNGHAPYNSADPKYDPKLRAQYQTILKRKPQYYTPN